MKVVGEGTCRAPEDPLRLEWLETNGRGGYASSTILNCNTRKYHGLLVASLSDPPGRFVLLSKVEDSLLVSGRECFLSSHQYPGVLFPPDQTGEAEFRIGEQPSFLYRFGGTSILKRILMVRGENTTLIRYDVESGSGPVILKVKPLLAFRGLHEVRRRDAWFNTNTTAAPGGFRIQPYDGLPALFVQTSVSATFQPAPDWYYNFEYAREFERGYDWREDLLCPGVMQVRLQPGDSVIVSASTKEQADVSIPRWDSQSRVRRKEIEAARTAASSSTPRPHVRVLAALVRSGQRFLIRAPDGRPTIIAGYPWFDDWSRDTLISLPGLTFCSGKPAEGAAILKAIGEHERDGLLPNYFAADSRYNSYNSVDASLWYFWAVQQMLIHTGDAASIRASCWPVMRRILQRLMAGTSCGIFMNRDGLLHAGNEQTQLTWMDATVHGKPVTPRHGYAVEINALWYNALCFARQLADLFDEKPAWLSPALTDSARTAFVRMFWLDDEGYLADTGSDNGTDRSIRPNQILAVSLPFTPLAATQCRAVVETVRRELLTPFGLRTLSPRSPAYRGRYEGDQAARDAAYHQGTVWPWLLGHYAEAVLRTSDDPAGAARDLLATIQPLLDYCIDGDGLSNVPEIFDGDPPHRPNGCFAQAWSTGELIRLFCSFQT